MFYTYKMHILTIIAVLGGLQGLIVLLSIIFRFRHRKNLPLALLLVVFSLRLATIPTWKPEFLLAYPWIYPMTAPLPFLFSFLIWWYIRELVSDTLNTPKPLYIHFAPYALEITAVTLTLLSMDRVEYTLFIRNIFEGNPPLWLPVRNGLKVLVNFVYLFFSARIAFGAKSKKVSRTKRSWIRSLVIAPLLVLASFAYVAVLPSVSRNMQDPETAGPFLLVSVTMGALIYFISFLLLTAPDISLPDGKCSESPAVKLCTDTECRHLMDKVEKRFNDGVWQNPDLTLSDLASELKIHPNRLSYVINHCSRVSFRCYLNTWRLEHFINMVNQSAHREHSILDLAFDAGFPSKTTFNRFFMEKKGMTPSEYIKQTETEIS